MSTCTKWVDQVVITCKNWGQKVDYVCTEWADEGSNKCSEWADEGSNKCSEWADEGKNKCCTWWPCSWGCKALVWVSKWVCKGWYWVSKWVCKGWYWVAKWVCKASAWLVKVFCVTWSWGMKLVCAAWDTLKCAILNLLKGLKSLFGEREREPKIEHFFVLMMENQSFDRLFGFSDLRGVDAVTGEQTTLNGVDPGIHTNTHPGTGQTFPVRFPADMALLGVDKDPGHEFLDTVTQLCGSKDLYDPDTGVYPNIDNSGFVADYLDTGSPTPGRIMDCHSPEQLPVLNTLAREFAICDNWFSSLPGPTFPNRFFLHAATSGGLDASPSKLDIVAATTVDGFRFENGTIFDLLDDACIEWSIFEGDEFPVTFLLSGMNLNMLQGRFKEFSDFESELNRVDFSEKFIFIEPKYGKHDFAVTGPGDFTCGNSMHPLDDMTRGERLIKEVYETIRNSPLWEKSALVITVDEHGGFYDHVAPPPATPPGDVGQISDSHHGFKFDRLGVRVPAIVISPYTQRGTIDHTTYDHTSLLATLERTWGLKNLTERDKAANDFLHLFSRDEPRTDAPTRLPEPLDAVIDCDDVEVETVEDLLASRSELIQARDAGVYQDHKIEGYEVTPMQRGFNSIALLKMLHNSEFPERDQWLEDFKNIQTGIDAALFMTEAKLKIQHEVDLKKCLRENRKYKG
jgi:phospholipase C